MKKMWLTCDLLVLEDGEFGVGALPVIGVLVAGQILANGQPKVSSRLRIYALGFVLFEQRPFVVAEGITYGYAILSADDNIPNRTHLNLRIGGKSKLRDIASR